MLRVSNRLRSKKVGAGKIDTSPAVHGVNRKPFPAKQDHLSSESG